MTNKHKHADLIKANLYRFEYQCETGKLFWKYGQRRGLEAGWLDSSGYLQVKIDGKCVLVHRIIWTMFAEVTPEMPLYPEQIDHINRIRTDNRIENLRSSTNTKNQHNASIRKDNTTGCAGVIFRNGKYQARISVNGERKHLGTFVNIKDAADAYKQAKETYHGYTA